MFEFILFGIIGIALTMTAPIGACMLYDTIQRTRALWKIFDLKDKVIAFIVFPIMGGFFILLLYLIMYYWNDYINKLL